jgi:hypothetical protein
VAVIVFFSPGKEADGDSKGAPINFKRICSARRWSTQQGMMATVQRNKDALWQYIADDRAECSPEIKTIITYVLGYAR